MIASQAYSSGQDVTARVSADHDPLAATHIEIHDPAIEGSRIEGKVQNIDASASTFSVLGYAIATTSDTSFDGVSGLSALGDAHVAAWVVEGPQGALVARSVYRVAASAPSVVQGVIEDVSDSNSTPQVKLLGAWIVADPM
jgi:hypothetical protein